MSQTNVPGISPICILLCYIIWKCMEKKRHLNDFWSICLGIICFFQHYFYLCLFIPKSHRICLLCLLLCFIDLFSKSSNIFIWDSLITYYIPIKCLCYFKFLLTIFLCYLVFMLIKIDNPPIILNGWNFCLYFDIFYSINILSGCLNCVKLVVYWNVWTFISLTLLDFLFSIKICSLCLK